MNAWNSLNSAWIYGKLPVSPNLLLVFIGTCFIQWLFLPDCALFRGVLPGGNFQAHRTLGFILKDSIYKSKIKTCNF